MGVLSAPQRVEILSGEWGAVGGTITGARGCAAGELDLGPGGGFWAGRGLLAGVGGGAGGRSPQS